MQGELTLVVDTEAFIGYSSWFVGPPPCDGWYDTKGPSPFPAPGHQERMWFEHDEGIDGVGCWKETPDSKAFTPYTRAFHHGMQWRGLAKPWPWGYRFDVPGAKHYRAQLLEA